MNRFAHLSGLVLFFSATAFICGQTADRDALIDAARDLRAASIKSVTAGRGIALVSIDVNQPVAHLVQPLHKVEFVFLGDECCWKEFDPVDDNKVIRVVLISKGRRIDYYSGPGPAPKSVSITNSTHGMSELDAVPVEWSYKEFCRLPSLFSDEQKFFGYWTKLPYATAQKEKSIVDISLPFPQSEIKSLGLSLENGQVRLDTSMGAMMSYYEFNTTGTTTAIKAYASFENKDVLKMTWRREGDDYLPLVRDAESVFKHDGKDAGYTRGHAEFKEFHVGSVKSDELQLGAMNIPDGVVVVDNVHDTEFAYSADAEKAIFDTPSTQKQK